MNVNEIVKPSGQSPIRHVRVPDAPWEAAKERAAREGLNISAVVRDLVRDYANGHVDVVRK